MTSAAIVVTYNSARQVERCLSALVEGATEVYVVDNASTDGTSGVVRARFPHVRLIENRENVGFAAAVNQALEQTDADAVLLVNPDCVVPRDMVTALASHLRANPDVGLVAPRLRDEDGHVATSAHPFESLFTVVASRFGGSLVPLRLRRALAGAKRRESYDACRAGGEATSVDWVSGACVAVRGSLFRRLGGLDRGYFMYYEDEELCLQVWKAGFRVVILPDAEAVHTGGASSSDPAHVWPHLYRSLLRFQARHRPHTYGLVRLTILARAVVGMAVGAVHDAVALGRGRPARRVRAWARIARIAALESSRAELGATP